MRSVALCLSIHVLPVFGTDGRLVQAERGIIGRISGASCSGRTCVARCDLRGMRPLQSVGEIMGCVFVDTSSASSSQLKLAEARARPYQCSCTPGLNHNGERKDSLGRQQRHILRNIFQPSSRSLIVFENRFSQYRRGLASLQDLTARLAESNGIAIDRAAIDFERAILQAQMRKLLEDICDRMMGPKASAELDALQEQANAILIEVSPGSAPWPRAKRTSKSGACVVSCRAQSGGHIDRVTGCPWPPVVAGRALSKHFPKP